MSHFRGARRGLGAAFSFAGGFPTKQNSSVKANRKYIGLVQNNHFTLFCLRLCFLFWALLKGIFGIFGFVNKSKFSVLGRAKLLFLFEGFEVLVNPGGVVG